MESIENTAMNCKLKDQSKMVLEAENTATNRNIKNPAAANMFVKNMAMGKSYDENIAADEGDNTYGVFIPGDVVEAFNAVFLEESVCRHWVIGQIHRGKFSCPECGARVPDNLIRSFWDAKRIECDNCGKWFTALTGTFLSGCHLNFQQIVLLYYLIGLNVPDKEIARIISISPCSVRLWRLTIKELEKIVRPVEAERSEG
jgi:predicted RNA-binding Zn-ribbon protein involved in translation (DUF1610 family)